MTDGWRFRQVALDGVLPDPLIPGQPVHVLGRLLLVLAVLQQHGASRPEDGPTGAILGLRQRAEANLARVFPRAGKSEVRILVLDVVGGRLRGKCLLIWRLVHAAVGRAGIEHVRVGQRHHPLHDLERLDRRDRRST